MFARLGPSKAFSMACSFHTVLALTFLFRIPIEKNGTFSFNLLHLLLFICRTVLKDEDKVIPFIHTSYMAQLCVNVFRTIWQTSGPSLLDHPTQNFHSSPPGGTDTDKQNRSTQLAYVCLSLSHLAAINKTKGGVTYNFWPAFCQLKGLQIGLIGLNGYRTISSGVSKKNF